MPNFGRPGTGAELAEGLVIAIEPMVNAGGHEVILGDDGWTITTQDGSLSAHWEHTVAVTADGPRILTLGAREQGPRRRGSRGPRRPGRGLRAC